MSLSPPPGSDIKIEIQDGHHKVTIPHSRQSPTRFLVGFFVLFWLGGWMMGFSSAIDEIMSGKGGAFLLFWLGGWTIGGIVAAYVVFSIFRKPVPETYLLNKPYLTFDTGIQPFSTDSGSENRKAHMKSMFSRRKRIQFNHLNMKTLKLRETDNGNRLTIDHGTDRLELAKFSSEIEREWLFNYLQSNYHL